MIEAQDESMKDVKNLNIADIKLFTIEESNVLFSEIDNDNGGTLSLDEVFYWTVNQMKGLQYNFRTQINKHIRKAYKIVDENGDGSLDRGEFNLMLQYISYYFRVFLKFTEVPDNNWVLDKDQFKKHKIKKWVEGNSIDEKFTTVTKGKSDKATFTTFIEYGSDLISRLCKTVEVKEVLPIKNNDDELNALKDKIAQLLKKIGEQDVEIKRLKNDLLMSGQSDELNKTLAEDNAKLKAQNKLLEKELDKLKSDYLKREKELEDKLNEMNKKYNNLSKEFNDFKEQAMADANSTNDKLNKQLGDLNIENTKLKDELDIKNTIINDLGLEIKNLSSLNGKLEDTIKCTHAECSGMKESFDKYKQNADAEVNHSKQQVADLKTENNKVNTLYKTQLAYNKTMEAEMDKTNKESSLIKECNDDFKKLLNESISNYKISETENLDLKRKLEFNDKENTELNHNLDKFKNKYENISTKYDLCKSQFDELTIKYQTSIEECKIHCADLRKKTSELENFETKYANVQDLLKNLNVKYQTVSEMNEESRHVVRENSSEYNRLIKENNLLKLRVEEFESRQYDSLLEMYKNLVQKYSTDVFKLREDMAQSTFKITQNFEEMNTPAYKEITESIQNKNNIISQLKDLNSNLNLKTQEQLIKLNSLERQLHDYEVVKKVNIDLQNEISIIRPRYQELVEIKTQYEKKFHEEENGIKDNTYNYDRNKYDNNNNNENNNNLDNNKYNNGYINDNTIGLMHMENKIAELKDHDAGINKRMSEFNNQLDLDKVKNHMDFNGTYYRTMDPILDSTDNIVKMPADTNSTKLMGQSINANNSKQYRPIVTQNLSHFEMESNSFLADHPIRENYNDYKDYNYKDIKENDRSRSFILDRNDSDYMNYERERNPNQVKNVRNSTGQLSLNLSKVTPTNVTITPTQRLESYNSHSLNQSQNLSQSKDKDKSHTQRIGMGSKEKDYFIDYKTKNANQNHTQTAMEQNFVSNPQPYREKLNYISETFDNNYNYNEKNINSYEKGTVGSSNKFATPIIDKYSASNKKSPQTQTQTQTLPHKHAEELNLNGTVKNIEEYASMSKKQSAVYDLDSALSEYCAERRLKFKFQRFSDNVYIYGTKCVTLKFHEGEIMAKVGGGWMQLVNFIDTYEGMEEEKQKMSSFIDLGVGDQDNDWKKY